MLLKKRKSQIFFTAAAVLSMGVLIAVGFVLLWISTLKIPSAPSLEGRKIIESTKIYDRTGKTLLYDVHNEVRRTVIPFDEIPRYVKNATVAIEDDKFYQHSGISFWSIIRAVGVDLLSRSFKQGGSTITQQLAKNALLSREQTLSRKVKEFILSLKIERAYSKDQILNIYLNEIPYGSSIYGIESASEVFFGKKAEDLTLGESAYLASLPNAPTYYSPYGGHKDELEKRKDLVLKRMHDLGFISREELDKAAAEKPVFLPKTEASEIKAPHFVMYVKDYLINKYGDDMVENGGLKVVTTLDWELEKKAEELVQKYAEENEKTFNAYNAGLVGIDPKTGQILVMVGSRDWFQKPLPKGCSPGFDCRFEPKVNVATYGGGRQPGSSIKPFVYATAFKKGFTPDTAVFDVPTEFNPLCKPDSSEEKDKDGNPCYHPQNYDAKFRGPVTLREALAQSINVPSVKVLYLADLNESLKTAKDFGINTLNEPDRYGLTLVLGGGEVKLLELTSAYAIFANDGLKNPSVPILAVEDKNGNVLENFNKNEKQVINPNIARMISDVLSDNKARTPAFGEHSYLYFPEREVAVKTGTTNDYKDAWVLGYTPNFTLGVWVGNNDNSPMEKKVAGFIAAPLWNAFFKEVFKNLPLEGFKKPEPAPKPKPVLKGEWRGNAAYLIDSISGKLATDFTPKEFIKEKVITEIHSILYWIDKKNVLGEPPQAPQNDSQFNNWEFAVREWAKAQNIKEETANDIPKESDDVHKPEYNPVVAVISPTTNQAFSSFETVKLKLNIKSHFPIKQVDFFLSNRYLGSVFNLPFDFSFNLSSFADLSNKESVGLTAYDEVGNSTTSNIPITISGI